MKRPLKLRKNEPEVRLPMFGPSDNVGQEWVKSTNSITGLDLEVLLTRWIRLGCIGYINTVSTYVWQYINIIMQPRKRIVMT